MNVKPNSTENSKLEQLSNTNTRVYGNGAKATNHRTHTNKANTNSEVFKYH